MAMKKGEVMECKACGVKVTCTKGCDCKVTDMYCCGVPMNKAAGK